MNACALPNGPSWSDQAIAENWAGLRASLPREWLPVRGQDTELTQRPTFDEYGCGSYGCVYSTEDPRVVFKLTSDPTEADFIGILRALKVQIPGIVHYLRIFRMKGVRNRTHLHRMTRMPLYAIVRESADKVGKMNDVAGADRASAQRVLGLLTSFKEIAASMRKFVVKIGPDFARASYEGRHDEDASEYLEPATASEMRPGSRIRPAQVDLHLPADWPDDRQGALAYSTLLHLAKSMEREPVGYWIGSAMVNLLEGGIVLADVHHKNVGVVQRDREKAWVITDPGHCVRLRADLPRVEIPQL